MLVAYYRRVLAILMTIVVIFTFAGCKTESESKVQKESEESEDIQIGLSIDSFLIERWARERDLFVSKAQELGAQVNVQNANGEIEAQIKQLRYFIDKKVDVIVVVAIDDLALKDVVADAKKAGIKIIAYDRPLRESNADLYLSVDNEKVGELMATYIKKKIGNKGTIIQIKGSPTDYNVQMVQAGFEKIINTTNIKIDYAEYSEGWVAENAFSITNGYLKTGRIPSAIMCGNDTLAAQAIRALNENRLGGKVCVVGQDADLEACQRIVEGTQYMTVFKPVEKLAQKAAKRAVDMAKGIPLGLKETFNDGIYDVPYEKLDPVAVTKENMDEIITGKYHQRSEIYLNMK